MTCSLTPTQLDIWMDLGNSSGGGSSSSSCPVNPDFLGEQNFMLSLPWGDIAVMAEAVFTGSAVEVTFQGVGISHTQTFSPRFRREYGDYTLEEFGKFNVTINGPGGQTADVEFDLTFDPTCRKADTAAFCGNCLDENLYNVIDLADLDAFPLTHPQKCAGKPIDINVVCGVMADDDPGGDEVIPGNVTMYYAPYSNTIPVINNIAYDTTNLPPPPPGKINIIKITTSETRNGVRNWVCNNLMFATISGTWPPPPPSFESSSSSGRAVEDSLDFNWPFNDLYFSKGCPGGDTVNLIPC